MAVKSKLRICFIADPGSIHIKRWISHFFARGYEISVISYNPVREEPSLPVKVYDLTRIFNGRGARYLVWGIYVRRMISKINPDILHAHNIAGAGWLGMFSGFHPFIATAHGSDMMLMEQRSVVYQKLNALVLKSADYITAGSWALYDRCLRYGANSKQTDLLMIGTDTTVFNSAIPKTHARKKLNLGVEPIIFFIRSIHDIYNPGIMADAMAMLRDILQGGKLVFPTVTCNPVLMADLRQKIDRLGLSDQVIYLDAIQEDAEMALWYRAADICVSIPSSDGISIAVVEAMACGRPVVITDLPAYTGIFRHMNNVFKVPVNDSSALSSGLRFLLSNENKRQDVGKQAGKTVCEYADHDRAMRRMEEIYETVAVSRSD